MGKFNLRMVLLCCIGLCSSLLVKVTRWTFGLDLAQLFQPYHKPYLFYSVEFVIYKGLWSWNEVWVFEISNSFPYRNLMVKQDLNELGFKEPRKDSTPVEAVTGPTPSWSYFLDLWFSQDSTVSFLIRQVFDINQRTPLITFFMQLWEFTLLHCRWQPKKYRKVWHSL